MEKEKDFLKSEYYENRELSWLKFNHRVLNEARDKTIPLLERLKFVSITSSNLDEFFMVRVASLKDMVHAGYKKKDIAGMTAQEQLDAINKDTRALVEQQYSTYNRSLLPLLHNQGIDIISAHEELTPEQAEYVDRYFQENVYPVLTPMAVDASRPFPLIRNKSLNIAALLTKKDEKKGETEFATVQVPSVLPRIVQIPSVQEGTRTFLLLEQVIERNIHHLFLNYHVLCAYPYRIMRNADLSIDEDEAEDLLQEIQKQLKRRQWGEVIRLEVEEKVDKRLLQILQQDLHIAPEDIFKIGGPLDLTFLMKMYGIEGGEELRYPSYKPQRVPQITPGEDIFATIRKGDILLHHPYQTFDPVVDFIRQASVDPDVLAIKQTLYRVSGHSPIIAALAQAGYTSVTLADLRAYVEQGAELPEKPIVITFDDGYLSNMTYGLPILEKYGMNATIFVIGCSVGKDTYKDTGQAMTPHFTAEQARALEDTGLVTIGSHGYDIHEVEGRDPDPIRHGVLQREGESEKDYIAFLQGDCARFQEVVEPALGRKVDILAYPYGQCSPLSEILLAREGFYATVTTIPGVNTLVKGLPQTLRAMDRFDIEAMDLTGEELLELLEKD